MTVIYSKALRLYLEACREPVCGFMALRILLFPGFKENATVFHQKVCSSLRKPSSSVSCVYFPSVKFAAVQNECGHSVEFGASPPNIPISPFTNHRWMTSSSVFLDLPHAVKPMTMERDSRLSSIASYDNNSTEPRPRSWWFWNEPRTMYIGHLEAIRYVRDFLAKTEVPFHVSAG